jgi:hypothetical protein
MLPFLARDLIKIPVFLLCRLITFAGGIDFDEAKDEFVAQRCTDSKPLGMGAIGIAALNAKKDRIDLIANLQVGINDAVAQAGCACFLTIPSHFDTDHWQVPKVSWSAIQEHAWAESRRCDEPDTSRCQT